MGQQLSDALDVGSALSREVGNIPEKETAIVMNSIGYDLLIFLAASVVITPIASVLGISTILAYLIAGAILGPNGFDMFANAKADVELGDFGILFLLFSEGLDVSKERLGKLSNYLPLGLAQIALVTGVITFALLTGIPQMLGNVFPLDPSFLPQRYSPTEGIVLGLAGALSTSAFIFPVLKERGWEDQESGEAATSILLLQDLMVAPLLVLLPYLVGQSDTDYTAIGFLTLKATLGFGTVIYAGRIILKQMFAIVAQTQNSETFVAACLFVSLGMGVIAKGLGLTDTAGAFAAGVLLANTNYRAQIKADIQPFTGILLGIFFMDAGSNFDTSLVLQEWPTVVAGTLGLLVIKASTLWLATRVPEWMEPNRLPAADAARVSLLLAGGGEFAFVVLALATRLDVVPGNLGALLTAVILITMALTPLLGNLAAIVSEPLLSLKEEGQEAYSPEARVQVASDSVVVCGYGEVGQSVLRVLGDLDAAAFAAIQKANDIAGSESTRIVAFDTDPTLAQGVLRLNNRAVVMFGNAANQEVIRSSGITSPACFFVAYEDHNRVLQATSRLRNSFADTPIYTRAATRLEAEYLRDAGATEVVIESDELPKSASALVQGIWSDELSLNSLEIDDSDPDKVRAAVALVAGISLSEASDFIELYRGMDQDGSGEVNLQEIDDALRRSSHWIASDDEIRHLDAWLAETIGAKQVVSILDLCRLYRRAPDYVRKAFGLQLEVQ
jgi:Kef-type K+ transport system membrane component KefB/voltage-gated potassium channel Kch